LRHQSCFSPYFFQHHTVLTSRVRMLKVCPCHDFYQSISQFRQHSHYRDFGTARRWDISKAGSHPLHERQYNVPPKDPRDQVFGHILRAAGIRDVFYEPIRNLGERHTSLGNLQRMILRHLQRELVEDVSKIKTARAVDGTQAGKIESAWSSNRT
jgi:hypothetical protein